MEHFELRDQYLSSLPQLFLSLDNADEHLETKIRSHFLQVCKELECKAKDMDYVNDQSRRREKTLLGKIDRQMRQQAASGSTASPSSATGMSHAGFPGSRPETRDIPTPSESSKSSNNANVILQSQSSRLLAMLQPRPVLPSESPSIALPSLLSNAEFIDLASKLSARQEDAPSIPATPFPGLQTTPQFWSRRLGPLSPGLYEPTAEMGIEVSGPTNDDPDQEAIAVGGDNITNEAWLEQLGAMNVDDIFGRT